MQGTKPKTIITRVPPALATEVEKRVAEEMLSVACFVRRLLASVAREKVA